MKGSIITNDILHKYETSERSNIEAFEIKMLKKVIGISWFDHRTNDNVIERVGRPKSLLNKITAAQLSCFGHIRRRDGTSLESTVMTGSVEVSRGQGRPRTTRAKTLMAATKNRMHELHDLALDRTS